MSIYSQVNKLVLRRPVERGQYVSLIFGQRLRNAGIAQSMGSKGDCYDNAVCESFHATLEKELLRQRSFRTRQEARTAIFDWIEAWYNRERRHSRLDYRSPDQYERDYARGDCADGTDEEIFIEHELPNVYVSTKPTVVHCSGWRSSPDREQREATEQPAAHQPTRLGERSTVFQG